MGFIVQGTLWLRGHSIHCPFLHTQSPLLATHSLFSSMLGWGFRPCIFHPGASGCSLAPVPLPWRAVLARAPREPPSQDGGTGAAPGQHGAALRLRPGRPAEAARFPVVSPLTFQQNRSRGPGPGERLPASGRFLPWLGAREGRPQAPSLAAHLPPGLSAQQPAPQWSVPQMCLSRVRGWPWYLQKGWRQ